MFTTLYKSIVRPHLEYGGGGGGGVVEGTQGPFHQSLVAIGPVVSEEKIKMCNVDGRTTDEK